MNHETHTDYVAGVLDRDSVIPGIGSLAEKAEFQPGDRVKTMEGSATGTILHGLQFVS